MIERPSARGGHRTKAGSAEDRLPGRHGARVARLQFAQLLVVTLAMMLGCEWGSTLDAPNLVLVVFDTTRRDHTSLHGYERATTPVLLALAAEGARFDAAYAPTSSTGPTHASLFTGRYPIEHRVIKNGVVLAGEWTTLAEHLSALGWDTAGFVGSFVLDSVHGFDQGFAQWDAEFTKEGSSWPMRTWEGHEVEDGAFDRRARETTDRVLSWLERRGDQPFFLFVHYYDPHAPYTPLADDRYFEALPRSGRLQVALANYDSEIRLTDAQLGRLLEALENERLAERTLVVVTADHGEGLMDHGIMTHGAHIYEEQVQVPLVMRMPGVIPAGFEMASPVELLDVAPTALDLLGAPPLSGTTGRSLAGALRGTEELPADRPILLYRRHYVPQRQGNRWVAGEKFAIREGNWKLIAGEDEGPSELYDLATDPNEKKNLFAPDHPEAQRLAGKLRDWKVAHEWAGSGEPPVIDDAVREGLEALGYVE